MNSRHADLINSLRKTERLTDKTAHAMMQVDRKFFLDPDNQSLMHLAYEVYSRLPHGVPAHAAECMSAVGPSNVARKHKKALADFS